MLEYPKMQSVFKRDEQTFKFIEGEFSLPEFEFLQDVNWIWTEKIDGTNIRIDWDGEGIQIGGRTDRAQIPTFLYTKLQQLFSVKRFKELYPETPMCLYGEGYGAKIQKGGGNYIPDGVDFILFDILIETWWLKREDVQDIADYLGIKVVPVVDIGTLLDAVKATKDGLMSYFGNFYAEGLVLKPYVELQTRSGSRIITKMKHKDF